MSTQGQQRETGIQPDFELRSLYFGTSMFFLLVPKNTCYVYITLHWYVKDKGSPLSLYMLFPLGNAESYWKPILIK